MEEFLNDIEFIDFMSYKAAAIIAMAFFMVLLMDNKNWSRATKDNY